VFNKCGRQTRNCRFWLGDQLIDIVQDYCYLGIVFNISGSFKLAEKTLKEKAMKAMFALRKSLGDCNVKLCMKLFHTMIVPICTYGCDVWSSAYFDMLGRLNLYQTSDKPPAESLHLRFCKYTLGVHKNASNAAVRGDLGAYPILLYMAKALLRQYSRVKQLSPETFVHKSYLECVSLAQNGVKCWLTGVNSLLTHCNIQSDEPRCAVDTLQHMYCQQWHSVISRTTADPTNGQNKLRTYMTFKSIFKFEDYLCLISNRTDRSSLTKLRISAHRLLIGSGRYVRPRIDVSDRICPCCNMNTVEDEIHFLLHCPLYSAQRNSLFEQISNIFPNFQTSPDSDKLIFLMSYVDCELAQLVASSISLWFNMRQTLVVR
jgi:hypothetical protein